MHYIGLALIKVSKTCERWQTKQMNLPLSTEIKDFTIQLLQSEIVPFAIDANKKCKNNDPGFPKTTCRPLSDNVEIPIQKHCIFLGTLWHVKLLKKTMLALPGKCKNNNKPNKRTITSNQTNTKATTQTERINNKQHNKSKIKINKTKIKKKN